MRKFLNSRMMVRFARGSSIQAEIESALMSESCSRGISCDSERLSVAIPPLSTLNGDEPPRNHLRRLPLPRHTLVAFSSCLTIDLHPPNHPPHFARRSVHPSFVPPCPAIPSQPFDHVVSSSPPPRVSRCGTCQKTHRNR